MALELLHQCQPILKVMLEQAQAVWVCPVSSESEHAQDEHTESTPEIQTEREQTVDRTCSSSVTEVSNCTEGSVDETVRAVKCGVSDAVTDGDFVNNSKSDMMDPTEVEVTVNEHNPNSGCDSREECGEEAQLSSGSDMPQDRNKTKEELAEQEEASSLVHLLEQRLQFVLRSLTKLCLSKTGSTKKDKE
jgi:preprotein translocase subunit Sec63